MGTSEAAAGTSEGPLVEGALNFRDLGGHGASGGLAVRHGAVYRSGTLSRLTDAGVGQLSRLGVRLVLDFRTRAEVTARPDRLPAPPPRVIHRPVGDGDRSVATLMGQLAAGNPAPVREALAGGGGERLMLEAARRVVTDPDARAAWAVAIRELGEPRSLPAVVHCTGGKDRTGFAAALVLLAVGVPREAAIEDYLLSNQYLAAFARVVRDGIEPDLLRPVVEVRRAYIETSLEVVDRRYGSLDGYLHRGLGLDDDALHRLRQALLSRAPPPGRYHRWAGSWPDLDSEVPCRIGVPGH
jgi:protein-tyrosine phosphatase